MNLFNTSCHTIVPLPQGPCTAIYRPLSSHPVPHVPDLTPFTPSPTQVWDLTGARTQVVVRSVVKASVITPAAVTPMSLAVAAARDPAGLATAGLALVVTLEAQQQQGSLTSAQAVIAAESRAALVQQMSLVLVTEGGAATAGPATRTRLLQVLRGCSRSAVTASELPGALLDVARVLASAPMTAAGAQAATAAVGDVLKALAPTVAFDGRLRLPTSSTAPPPQVANAQRVLAGIATATGATLLAGESQCSATALMTSCVYRMRPGVDQAALRAGAALEVLPPAPSVWAPALGRAPADDAVVVLRAFNGTGPYFWTESGGSPVAEVRYQSPNGTRWTIHGLAAPFQLRIRYGDVPLNRSVACAYFDSARGAWAADGLTAAALDSALVECATTHLTDFYAYVQPPGLLWRVAVPAATWALWLVVAFAAWRVVRHRPARSVDPRTGLGAVLRVHHTWLACLSHTTALPVYYALNVALFSVLTAYFLAALAAPLPTNAGYVLVGLVTPLGSLLSALYQFAVATPDDAPTPQPPLQVSPAPEEPPGGHTRPGTESTAAPETPRRDAAPPPAPAPEAPGLPPSAPASPGAPQYTAGQLHEAAIHELTNGRLLCGVYLLASVHAKGRADTTVAGRRAARCTTIRQAVQRAGGQLCLTPAQFNAQFAEEERAPDWQHALTLMDRGLHEAALVAFRQALIAMNPHMAMLLEGPMDARPWVQYYAEVRYGLRDEALAATMGGLSPEKANAAAVGWQQLPVQSTQRGSSLQVRTVVALVDTCRLVLLLWACMPGLPN